MDDRFGSSVALSDTVAFVGAAADDAYRGAVYVFPRVGSGLGSEQKLVANDGVTGDGFGASIAVLGNRAFVGAPLVNGSRGAVYVFTGSGSTWTPTQKVEASDAAAGDQFGQSLAVSGNLMVVGAPGNNGAAYFYSFSGSSWGSEQKITASGGASGEQFGGAVALHDDRAIVGALQEDSGAGAAYTFVLGGTTWGGEQRLVANQRAASDNFGRSVAISGERLIVGSYYAQAAYAFTLSGSVWGNQQRLVQSDTPSFSRFGAGVAMLGDRAVVTAPSSRMAYVFGWTNTGWIERQKLAPSGAESSEEFGEVVALAGETFLAGAPGADTYRGAAYWFGIVGNTCDDGTDCSLGSCADGVCCNQPCGGGCEVCTTALGAVADGTCTLLPAGSVGDPACAPNACTGSSTNCDACSEGSHCPPGRFCASDGTCQLRRSRGNTCDTPNDCLGSECQSCASGLFCVDGVCCNDVCDEQCDACSTAAGATTNGTCVPVAVGSPGAPACPNPFACNGASDLCPTECLSDADCLTTHYCDPNGACLLRKPEGATCDDGVGVDCRRAACRVCQGAGGGYCVDGVCCDAACNGACDVCDESGNEGTCSVVDAGTPGSPVCASGAVCDGQSSRCPGECDADGDCPAGQHCPADGQCRDDLPPGDPCTRRAECGNAAPECADGVCCDTRCSGQCEACDVAGSEGACAPALGVPYGSRMPCSGEGEECGGECDGSDRAECRYPPATEACGGTCSDGVELPRSCDGAGACVEGRERPCGDYACGADACLTSCETDADCASGRRCENGACGPGTTTCSEDGTEVVAANGEHTPCAPYLCEIDRCGESCASVDDCAAGYVCDGSGSCVLRGGAAESEADGGCGCRVAGRPRGSSAIVLLALGLVGFGLARRRRTG